jgi:hypothetical protein
MTPKKFGRYLYVELTNGVDRLTDDEVAGALKIPKFHIPYYWTHGHKYLRRDGVCAIRITQYCIDHYWTREPIEISEAERCIAAHTRKGAGFRLMTAKAVRNDLIGLTYLDLYSMNARGMQSALLDRLTIEFKAGHITQAKALRKLAELIEVAEPEHAAEFAELVGRIKNGLKGRGE